MACMNTKFLSTWRSTDSRKAWPLLSRRLNRLVRQKPMRRLPARDRSSSTFASTDVGGVGSDSVT